jgi:thiamine pyrophosphokinase
MSALYTVGMHLFWYCFGKQFHFPRYTLCISYIAVAGALGGRLDHSLANLNALYKYQDLPLVLVGDGNIVRLLPIGDSLITMNSSAEGIQCGVIPLGSSSVVTSKGLKYDMGMVHPCQHIRHCLSSALTTCGSVYAFLISLMRLWALAQKH